MEYRALKEKQRLKEEQEERERIAATKVCVGLHTVQYITTQLISQYLKISTCLNHSTDNLNKQNTTVIGFHHNMCAFLELLKLLINYTANYYLRNYLWEAIIFQQ